MKKILFLLCNLTLQVALQAQTVIDYDGNVYDTVIIGENIWLKQNLKVTHYNNGVLIPNVTDSAAWVTLTTGARCYYKNDSSAYDSVYGPLYNWYAVNDPNNICPSGWHVSTNAEWNATEIYLGGTAIAGGKMKEAGIVHWKSPNTGATNSTGFTGLPGGARDPIINEFRIISENGVWWTASAYNTSMVWSTYMWYLNTGVDHNPVYKNYGFSIRCVKDIGTGIGEIDFNKIQLYPNPSSNEITIKTSELSTKGHLSILNLNGQQLLQLEITEPTTIIDVSTLPSGVYFVRVTGERTVKMGKFVKN
jgi:uncharacterized protein (TIGR02145 family)